MCVVVQNSRELRGYGSGERRIALHGHEFDDVNTDADDADDDVAKEVFIKR
jgi:hypothetical protein